MIDPKQVPQKTLSSGAKMPVIGLGTFGSDKYSTSEIGQAVFEAAGFGYRQFDCASVYRNEEAVGVALGKAMQTMPRDEFWITSKVWNDRHREVEASCEDSLRDLGLDYLDLFLVHWPFPNSHAPGVDVSSRDPHAVPYIHEQYMETWAQMESLHKRGLVRHIGTSNMTIPKLELLLRDASIKPVANEFELHPHFQQPELMAYILERGMIPIGFSPVGSPSRPERDRTAEDSVDIEDPVIIAIAERLQVHPAVVCVMWQVQLGSVPIPFSVKRPQFESALTSVVENRITDEEMKQIAGIDRQCRLIKGQVFLWEGARDWQDLWDLDGVIPG